MNSSYTSRNAWNPSKNTYISNKKEPSSALKTIIVFMLTILFFCIFGFYSLMAQSNQTIIQGHVKGHYHPDGLANVTITLSQGGAEKAKTLSQEKGFFKFDKLQPGTYELSAMAEAIHNYDPINKLEVSVKKGEIKNTELELLAVVEIEEEVVEEVVFCVVERVENYSSYRPQGAMSFNYNNLSQDSYQYIHDNGFKSTTHEPLSTFSIDVDQASYTNMRRHINEGKTVPKDAIRTEELINYFKYTYPQPKKEEIFSIYTEYGPCPWNPNHKILHIGIMGKEIDTKKMPPANLVLLIDVSGSMWQSNRLPLIKKSLRLLVNQLRAQDKVAIVTYAGTSKINLPATAGNEKEKIIASLGSLEAGGGTYGSGGILMAYQIAKENYIPNGNNRIILCTDGDFNVGVTSYAELERIIEEKRKEGIFLSILGFGMGNYKDDKLELLSNKGNGNYAYIDNLMEAQKVFVEQMGATLLTIASDVKIQAEFNPVHVKAYRLIGYENRLLNNEDFNDDSKDAGELGAGSSVTALYEIITDEKESENIIIPSELRYQNQNVISNPDFKGELAQISIRYKSPTEEKSALVKTIVPNKSKKMKDCSEDFLFAAAVAQYAMILRDSPFKGNAGFANTIELAQNNKGRDTEGYRAEFIRLLKLAESIYAQSDIEISLPEPSPSD